MLHVYAPDGEGRRDIISHYLNMKAHDPAMDIDFMVADSIGWTPVMIKTIINEALVTPTTTAGTTSITRIGWRPPTPACWA